jgi:cation diffusion facilitator family transporter
VAGPQRARLLKFKAQELDRYREVSRVLFRVLLLNLIVAGAKIVLGAATGAVSVLSDGLHSLTDGASNVVGMVGVRVASRPPDANHPYGHRKFETMAAVGILLFLLLVLIEVLRAAVERFQTGSAPVITPLTFVVMGLTFAVNVAVVIYERRAGQRLGSEILIADAMHTRSDLLTTITVIVALIGVRAGFPVLDPIAAIVVAVFIAHACWEIFTDTSRILSDEIVLPEDVIQSEVAQVPEVLGCHHIRTRGPRDHVFLDLHIWLRPNMSLFEAHTISHVVKDRLMARFPQIKDAIIHIEPPPETIPRRT